MANVWDNTDSVYLVSVNTPDFPEPRYSIITDISEVEGQPQRYWFREGSVMRLHDQATRDQIDADLATLQTADEKDNAKTGYDQTYGLSNSDEATLDFLNEARVAAQLPAVTPQQFRTLYQQKVDEDARVAGDTGNIRN